MKRSFTPLALRVVYLCLFLSLSSIFSAKAIPEKQKSSPKGQGKIVLETKKNIGETILLGIKAIGTVEIEGIEEEPKIGGEASVRYTLKQQVVTIKGDVTFLRCISGDLIRLDLNQCPELTDLRCQSNELTTLNLENSPKLQILWCNNNKISSLDLSHNPLLEGLWCYNNEITKIDLSKSKALSYLLCYWNKISELDLSSTPKMQLLECHHNDISTITLEDCPDIEKLYCNNNKLSKLTFAPRNEKLRVVTCHDNLLPELKLGNAPLLEGIYCYNNEIQKITFENSPLLMAVVCHNNQIKKAEMTSLVKALPDKTEDYMGGSFVVHETELVKQKDGNVCLKRDVAIAKQKRWNTYFYGEGYDYKPYEGEEDITNKPNRDISISTEKKEISMTIASPKEIKIDWGDGIWKTEKVSERGTVIKGAPLAKTFYIAGEDITILKCGNNEIDKLLLNNCPNLKVLYCYSNNLCEISFAKTPLIEELYIQDNKLQSVDLAPLSHLKDLNASNNKLETIVLDKSPLLISLSLLGNKLSSINVDNCPLLEDISLGYNSLTSLSIKKNPNLYWIIIYKNKFSESALKTLFEELPKRPNNDGTLKIFESKDDEVLEENKLNKEDLSIPKAKGWKVLDGQSPLSNPVIDKITNDEISFAKEQSGLIVKAPWSCKLFSLDGAFIGLTSPVETILTKNLYPSILLLLTPQGKIYKLSL